MSPDTVQLVQESFKKIVPDAKAIADTFYDRLFEIAPEVRCMFPDDMTDQKGKLMYMLGLAVKNLNRFDTLIEPVRELGAHHAQLRVQDEHYRLAGSALLYTLEGAFGEDWTPKVQEAWAEFYTVLATAMKDAPHTPVAAE